jgi:hypothetical protein
MTDDARQGGVSDERTTIRNTLAETLAEKGVYGSFVEFAGRNAGDDPYLRVELCFEDAEELTHLLADRRDEVTPTAVDHDGTWQCSNCGRVHLVVENLRCSYCEHTLQAVGQDDYALLRTSHGS